MPKAPYHFRFHDDALRGYAKLDLEERGAYTTLLDLMYSDQGHIEDDERRLAAEMRISMRKYRALRDRLLAAGKLYVPVKGFLSNHRVELELQRRAERAAQARKNGEAGGRKKAENAKLRNKINRGLYRDPDSSILPESRKPDSAPASEPPHIARFRKRLSGRSGQS